MDYQRPELTEKEKTKAKAEAQKILSQLEAPLFPLQATLSLAKDAFVMLAVENVRLVKEIQEHRAARGIEPLPTFEV